jgi:hypothetical protein
MSAPDVDCFVYSLIDGMAYNRGSERHMYCFRTDTLVERELVQRWVHIHLGSKYMIYYVDIYFRFESGKESRTIGKFKKKKKSWGFV